MVVSEDKKAGDLIYDKLAAQFKKTERTYTPKTFHVSDLLNPRQAFFKYTQNKPLTRDEIGYFTAGLAHHFIFETALVGENPEEVPIILEADGFTIIGRPDVQTYAFYNEEPNEIKTSRKWSIPEFPDDRYIDQLQCYCAISGKLVGRITVFYICPGRRYDGTVNTKPLVKAWKVQFEESDLATASDSMLSTAKILHKAITDASPSGIDLCEEWMCGGKTKDKKGVDIRCKFYHECKPDGRYPESRIR